MRGEIFKHWNIIAATLFSVVLIVGAYMFARGIESPQVAEASTETALLQAIASKDSDSDGLPDWEESLYGTDSHVADTLHLGMVDGEAVAKGLIVPKAIADIRVATSSPAIVDSNGLPPPAAEGTLTSAFTQTFFSLYVAAKQANGGAELTSSQSSALAEQAMNQLSQNSSPAADFKKQADIKISGSGPEALRAFAIEAEAVLKKNTTDATMSEIEYFQLAVSGDDASARTHLVSLSKAYRDSAVGISMLSVPEELATVHLAIVNSIMRLSEIDADFARVDSDPLTAMLALQQYKQTELDGENAFATLFNTYAAAGIVLQNGTPGASFVNIMANITAQQAAAKKS